MLQTKAFGAVSKSDLDAWANTYKLPVTAVKDPDGTGTATYNALGVRETVFELDLSTMKILKVIHGSTAGIPPSAVQQATADLHTLLGK